MASRNALRSLFGIAAMSLLLVASATPASANYDYLGVGSCQSTIFNGTTWTRTSVTSEASCASMLIGVKVQFPGTSAYWTGWRSGSGRILDANAPSGSTVIQSYHSVVSGAAWKFLSIV
jgi:hypothetical protein